MQEAGQRAFPFQSVFTVHASVEMSAKVFELLLVEVVVQIAQQVDVEVITGIHRFGPRRRLNYPAVLNTRNNTSNREIFPNILKHSPKLISLAF